MAFKRPKYVHEYKDRHGKQRVYYNRPGQPKSRLRGPVGSKEFWEDYHAADQGTTRKLIGADRVFPGSIGDLVARYYNDAKFSDLKDSTKAVTRRVLDAFCREDDRGKRPVKGFERKHMRAILNKMSDRKQAANNLLKRIKVLTKLAVENGMLQFDPLLGMSGFKAKEKNAHTWTDEDVKKFTNRHPPGSKAYLAMTLMLSTGQRLSDAVTMGWHHVEDDCINVKQQKTSAELTIPLDDKLRAAIELLSRDAPAFLMTEQGKPFTAKGFGNWMRDRCDEAGLPECSSHGLRSATATRLAESGCSSKQIMAITGHQTLKEVERYIKAAEQKKLAQDAMANMNKAQAGTNVANPNPAVSKLAG